MTEKKEHRPRKFTPEELFAFVKKARETVVHDGRTDINVLTVFLFDNYRILTTPQNLRPVLRAVEAEEAEEARHSTCKGRE